MFSETRKGAPSPPRTELERDAQRHSRTEHAYAGYSSTKEKVCGRRVQGVSDVISTERRPEGTAIPRNAN